MRIPWPASLRPAALRRALGDREHASLILPDRPRDEWRSLPPPAGLAGPPRLTADGPAFLASTAGRQGLPPVLEAIGRREDTELTMASLSEGPSRAASRTPRPAIAPARELAYAPPHALSHDPRGRALTGATEGLDHIPRSDERAPAHTAGPSQGLPTRPVPTHVVATVSDAADLRGRPAAPARALTIVPDVQRRAILDARAPGVLDVAGRPAFMAAAGPGSPGADVQREPPSPAGGGLGMATSGVPIGGERLLAGFAATMDDRSRPENRSRPVGESRRAGLGPPMPGGRVAPRDAGDSPSPAAAATQGRRIAGPTLAREASVASGHTGSSAATGPRAALGPTPRRAGLGAPLSTAPPHVRAVQRSSDDPHAHQSADAGPPGASGTHHDAVRIDRSDAGAAVAAKLGANAFTTADTIVLPASHGPLDRGRGRALLAHELVHVEQQRRLGRDLPPEGSSAGQALEREARTAEGLASGPLTRPPLPLSVPGARASGPVPGSPSLGRAATAPSPAFAAPTAPGRAVAGASMPRAVVATGDDLEAGRWPQRQAASDPVATSADAGHGAPSEAELEDLARRIYERIRHRLGRELLLDRERAGFLTDLP